MSRKDELRRTRRIHISVDTGFLMEYDALTVDRGFATRCGAIRQGMREQMKRWKRKRR